MPLKAALEGQPVPNNKEELDVLAAHCTSAEDAANKVDYQVEKPTAALLIESRSGKQYDVIFTAASEKGTWFRWLSLPIDCKLEHDLLCVTHYDAYETLRRYI